MMAMAMTAAIAEEYYSIFSVAYKLIVGFAAVGIINGVFMQLGSTINFKYLYIGKLWQSPKCKMVRRAKARDLQGRSIG